MGDRIRASLDISHNKERQAGRQNGKMKEKKKEKYQAKIIESQFIKLKKSFLNIESSEH